MKAIAVSLVFPVFLLLLKITKKNIWDFKAWLMEKQSPFLEAVYDHYFARYGAYVGLSARIAGEPCFPHGFYGVFISSGATLGKNVVIFQHVTLGSNSLIDGNQGSPTVGDCCYLGAGAKVVGRVVLGHNCRVGANAVVYRDLAPNSVAVQAPTRVIVKENLDNRFFTYRQGRRVYFDSGQWIEEA